MDASAHSSKRRASNFPNCWESPQRPTASSLRSWCTVECGSAGHSCLFPPEVPALIWFDNHRGGCSRKWSISSCFGRCEPLRPRVWTARRTTKGFLSSNVQWRSVRPWFWFLPSCGRSCDDALESNLPSFDDFSAEEIISLCGVLKVFHDQNGEESDYCFICRNCKEVFHRLCDGSPERKRRQLAPVFMAFVSLSNLDLHRNFCQNLFLILFHVRAYYFAVGSNSPDSSRFRSSQVAEEA